MKSVRFGIASIGAIVCCAIHAASPQTVIPRTQVMHQGSKVTVVANQGRPLQGAVEALRKEYGWNADFEDPIYSGTDLVDDTNPSWRLQHPSSKGVTRPAGGKFVTSFDDGDPAEILSRTGEERVLRSIVLDYNASGGPGQFEVRKSASGRLSVVGISRSNSSTNSKPLSILDTPITLEVKDRSAIQAVHEILNALQVQSGHKMLFWGPNNLLARTPTTIGGQNVSARDLLGGVANATKCGLSIDALYDADVDLYGLNMSMTTRSYPDAFGKKVEIVIGPTQHYCL